MKESLRPLERIRKKKDFLFLYKEGNRYRGKYFNIIFFPNSLTFSRAAFVASKKIGQAVARNKVKRWLRELFRRNKDLLQAPFDFIIIAKREIQDASWSDLLRSYLAALEVIYRERRSL